MLSVSSGISEGASAGLNGLFGITRIVSITAAHKCDLVVSWDDHGYGSSYTDQHPGVLTPCRISRYVTHPFWYHPTA